MNVQARERKKVGVGKRKREVIGITKLKKKAGYKMNSCSILLK